MVLADDVSPWLRPDAATCPNRSSCHTYCRGDAKHQMTPGRAYSVVAALEAGRTSWIAALDALRLQPGVSLAAVTSVQLRDVVERLNAAGQWHEANPKSCGGPRLRLRRPAHPPQIAIHDSRPSTHSSTSSRIARLVTPDQGNPTRSCYELYGGTGRPLDEGDPLQQPTPGLRMLN
ncbi:hypothetical protein [Streptomyces caelestis]|uniref:hypothetical protein n=1 Tax=Streptomyces caelestis TaxID=36816 RepID=UPI00361A7989